MNKTLRPSAQSRPSEIVGEASPLGSRRAYLVENQASDACDCEGGRDDEDDGIEHVTPQRLDSFDCPGLEPWKPIYDSAGPGHPRRGSSRFAE